MRWWAGGCAVAAVVLLAGCGTSGGSGAGTGASAGGTPSGGRSAGPSSPVPASGTSASEGGSASPGATASADGAPSPDRGCAAGHVDVTVSPGDPVRRRLCVRPGTVVTLVLRTRVDDKRWTGVRSSAPALVTVSGWHPAADGGARAGLRCAGTRGGRAVVTASAKAPDVAGAPRVAFTLDVDVVPYPREG